MEEAWLAAGLLFWLGAVDGVAVASADPRARFFPAGDTLSSLPGGERPTRLRRFNEEGAIFGLCVVKYVFVVRWAVKSSSST